MEHKREEILNKIKRVVIKVGSSSLTYENGHLNLSKIETLVRQISDIRNRGIEVVLVSSGAIAAGMGKLGFKERPKTIPEKQAAAAVGQGTLMHIYEKIFSEYSKVVGQILLTREDMSQRTRFLNGRNTFFSLLEQGVIPIVNENDAIVVEEIKFGDNDTLSAMVASLVEADLLIILSDIDGLYDSNPKTNPEAKLIYDVEYIDENIEKSAGGAGSKVGTGGMITKISAAKIAVASGTSMAILNAATPNVINEFLRGENVGTLFCALEDKLNARKHWLTFSTKSNGKIVIDKGAEKALLENHKSLLPSGVIKVIGSFSEEEVVSILNEEELEIAKGISNYSSSEVDIIKGMNSSLIEEKLNHKNYDEIVHKNNLVILKY